MTHEQFEHRSPKDSDSILCLDVCLPNVQRNVAYPSWLICAALMMQLGARPNVTVAHDACRC